MDRILFRDLKTENIAVDIRGEMRLFDFGLAKEIKEKDRVHPEGYELTGLIGSRAYSKSFFCLHVSSQSYVFLIAPISKWHLRLLCAKTMI